MLRQGVDAALAEQIVREIKDSKLKVQVSVQGDELRVTGKKRDDLQAAIASSAVSRSSCRCNMSISVTSRSVLALGRRGLDRERRLNARTGY